MIRIGHVLALFFSCSLAAFCQNKQFNHLTTDQGLTTGNIRVVQEDYQGLFWIGSEDGLLRYDGYDIEVYRHHENDSTSISSNFILALFEDSFNRLWIGTLDGGLCLYDRDTDSFRTFLNNPRDSSSLGHNYLRTFFESKDHKLYIGFENSSISILQLEETMPDKVSFENLTIPIEFDQEHANWGSSMVEDVNGHLLIGVNGGGIYKFDSKNQFFEPFLNGRFLKGGVQKLLMDSNRRLWVGTWNNGVFVYDYESDKIVNFNANQPKYNLNQNQIEALAEDQYGNVWIGTDNGLNLFSHEQDLFESPKLLSFKHSERDQSSLLSNAIKYIYVDSRNRVWISSYYSGINIYDKKSNKFNSIRSNHFEKNGLSFNNVVAFAEDSRKNIWIGSDGGGLDFVPNGSVNISKEVYQNIDLMGSKGKVKCIEVDSAGIVWVGTWGQGMFRLNPKSGIINQFLAGDTPLDITANEVLSLASDSLNNLWVGTFSGGLNYFNTRSGVFKKYPNLLAPLKNVYVDKINVLFIDSKNRLWAGPEAGGLCLYLPDTDSFKLIENETFDGSVTVLSIMESKDQSLWIGTNKLGLVNYCPKTEKTKAYNMDSGLSNNVIKAISGDSMGRIWVGSNKGLSVLNPKSGMITNYGKSNGIQGNEFNNSFLCSDGMMLFGGTNGMNAFYPENITVDSVMPEIVLTKFWLHNKEYGIGDPGTPLKKNIITTEKIDLTYDQHSFSIGYAALNYVFEEKNEYAYWLEGFHDDWQYVGTDRKASFTNLAPNDYTFHVKASNSDGIWGENEELIFITIKPAWWQTIYFKICLVVVLVLIILGYIRLRTTTLLKAQVELEKKVEQRTYEVRKLNQDLANSNAELVDQKENLEKTVDELSKTRNQLEISERMASLGVFTAGIAHEINNPINFISGASQKLFDLYERKLEADKDKVEAQTFGELKNILTVGIDRTVQIVNSLRNYARNQTDELEKYNIIKCLEDSLLILSHKIQKTSVKVLKNYPLSLEIMCFPGRISQVFINLISNSIDAMEDQGKRELQINITQQDDEILIALADTGIGIKEEDTHKLFDPFYSTKAVGKGTGLGLYIVYGIIEEHYGRIEVRPNNPGTIFEIHIPIASFA